MLFVVVLVKAEDNNCQFAIGLQSKNYFDVYANPYVFAIRKDLTTYLHEASWRASLKMQHIAFKDPLVQDTTCLAYYADSFSVIHIAPGDSGCWVGKIIFKHRPDKIFTVCVKRLDEGEYRLRLIEPAQYSQKEIAFLLKKSGKRLFEKSL